MGKLNKARNLLAAPFSVQSKQTGLKTAPSGHVLLSENTPEHSLLLRMPARLDSTDVTRVLNMSGGCVANAMDVFAVHGYILSVLI